MLYLARTALTHYLTLLNRTKRLFDQTFALTHYLALAAAPSPRPASAGGAWGIALLAAYMAQKEEGESLADYLNERVFGGQEGVTENPVPADVEGFDQFLKRYNEGLAIERAAVEHL